MLRHLLLVLLCLSPLGCFTAPKAAPRNDALFKAGEAGHWYLHAGSCFYELWGEVEFRCLPEDPAAKGVIKLLDSFSLRGFNLTPDKERFIVRSTPPGTPPGTKPLHYFAMDRELKVVDRDESLPGIQRLSPDGKYLLSVSAWEHGTGQIWLTEVTTKKRTVIATDHWKGKGPARGLPDWAPDSRRFVYTTNATELAIFDVTTGKAKVIGSGRAASWSPKGDLIAYLPATPRIARKVLQFDVAAGRSSELFTVRIGHTPIWGPDGRFVIFQRAATYTIYGDLSFFDREKGKLYRTGQRVASLSDSKVYTLPNWLVEKLVLVTGNPNREDLPVSKR